MSLIGTVSSNETKFALVQYETLDNFTLVPGNSCNASQTFQPIHVSFELNTSEISKNILIYKDSNAKANAYISVNADQIDKDNDNSMPYVR